MEPRAVNQRQQNSPRSSRRDFLKTSTAVAVGATPFWFATGIGPAAEFASPNERPVIGCIGTGNQWRGYDGPRAMQFFDCAARCDVDTEHLQKGLATGDRDHRRAAFLDRGEGVLGTDATSQHLCRILDLAASRTCEVADEERLELNNQWVFLDALDLLSEQIRGHTHVLSQRNAH